MKSNPRSRRAFTLIEVVLASMIGSLVLIAAVGVFATLSATDQRHKARSRQTNEISLAYRVLERSFQLLLMDDAPASADADARSRIERDLQRADGLLISDDGADLENARLLLIPDATAPGQMHGSDGSARPQLIRMALRSPPIAGGLPPRDAAAHSALSAPAALERPIRRTASANPGTRLTSDAAGEDEDDWDATAAEAARAPGVRAELILLPDEQQPDATPVSRSAVVVAGLSSTSFASSFHSSDDTQQGWTLWYREIPARTGADHLTPDERQRALTGDVSFLQGEINPSDLYYQPDSASFRRIPLISGIRHLEWRVYRRSRFVSQLAAIASRELPAYVEVSFELLNGRRENWMFEVAWTTGPEPGSLLSLGTDPLDLLVDPAEFTNPDGTPTNPQLGGGNGGGGPGAPPTPGGNTGAPTAPGQPARPGGQARPGAPTPKPGTNTSGGGRSNAPATPTGSGSFGTGAGGGRGSGSPGGSGTRPNSPAKPTAPTPETHRELVPRGGSGTKPNN